MILSDFLKLHHSKKVGFFENEYDLWARTEIPPRERGWWHI